MATPLLAESLPSLAAPAVAVKGYELTKTGIVFHRSLTDHEHDALGRRLATVANATQWQFGDWLCAATNRFDGIEGAFTVVHTLTGRSLETIRMWLKVSLAFTHDERDWKPWTFYRDALRLPTKDRLQILQLAQANHWTRGDLAVFINRRLGIGDDQLPPGVTDAVAARAPRYLGDQERRPRGLRHVRCPQCRHVFAAKGHGAPAPPAAKKVSA